MISSTYQQAGLQEEEEDSAWEAPAFRTESTYQQTLSHLPRLKIPYGNPFNKQTTQTFHSSPFSFTTGDLQVSQTPDFNSFFSNQVASFKHEVGFPFSQVHPPSVMTNIAAFSTNSGDRDSE